MDVRLDPFSRGFGLSLSEAIDAMSFGLVMWP